MAQSKPRPTQQRARETVEKLLDACAELLARGGYEALNTNAVAELAGVNIATLYRYFPNKEALLEHLLERFSQQQMAMVGEKLAANPDRNERVSQIVDALADMMIENPWMLALNNALNVSPQLQALRDVSQQSTIDAVRGQIPQDQQPRVSGKQQEAVLRLLLHLFGSGIELIVNSEPKDREAMTAELKVLLNSYLDNYRN